MTSTTLILYVHGALSTKNSWNYIRQAFIGRLPAGTSSDDAPHEEFIKYSLTRETSEEIVKGMIETVTKLIVKKKITKVVFIGHSFGGVLSVETVREMSEFLNDSNVKVKIISLSSPFGGNEIPPVIRVLRPNSIFFKNVGDHAPFIKEFKRHALPCKVHSFITTEGRADWMQKDNDGVVTLESQRFFEKDDLATLQEVKANHFEILLSDVVVTQLLKETR